MKNKTLIPLFVSAFLISVFLISACNKGNLQSIKDSVYIVTGQANGKQFIPANTLTGTSVFNGWYDEPNNAFTFTVKWDSLWTKVTNDAVTAVNFYTAPSSNVIGTLIHPINITNSNASSSANLALGGSVGLQTNEIADLYAGKLYYVICTAKYPSGAIRGRLNAVKRDPNAPVDNLVTSLIWASTNNTSLQIGDTATLKVSVYPTYASNKEITWTTSNAGIVTVTSTGKIKAVGRGIAQVTVTAKDKGGLSATCIVAVGVSLYQITDYKGWTVTASDERVDDGGGKNMILDGNFNTYWHSQWGPDVPLPHWLIIDMQKNYNMGSIKLFRRTANDDTKTVVVSVSSDGNTFNDVGTIGTFSTDAASGQPSGSVSFAPQNARYVKLLVTESNRGPYVNLTEVYFYEFR